MILDSVKENEKIIIGRNSHRSVIGGILLARQSQSLYSQNLMMSLVLLQI